MQSLKQENRWQYSFVQNLEETCENVSSIIVLSFQVGWLNPTDQLQYPVALATGTVHLVAPDILV
jgi:hypothetical protein